MKTLDLNEILNTHPYPGRGIVLGRSADGKKAVIVYFIMGRSENSRNRIFEATEDGIRTKAFDESKMTDPSLIIYHPVRALEDALNTREFEPDGPNYTPRISGVLKPDYTYNLSILKSLDGDPSCCCRYYYEYDNPKAGVGHFIHTYQENAEPLPSFEGEPRRVAITAPSAQALAQEVWANLNEDNKVSLFVQYIDLASGGKDTVILNKHQ